MFRLKTLQFILLKSDGIDSLTDNILHITSAYPNARMLITGDRNGRIGYLIDYIENDDIKHIFQNDNIFDYPSDTFH